jgi:hypothetical protein
LPSTPASAGMNLEKKHDIREKEKENDGAQINNLVELGFLKIFYLMCLMWKKDKVGVLVDKII